MSTAFVVTQDEKQVTVNRHTAIVVINFLIFLNCWFIINILQPIQKNMRKSLCLFKISLFPFSKMFSVGNIVHIILIFSCFFFERQVSISIMGHKIFCE